MVLEALMPEKKVFESPFLAFFDAFIVSSLAIWTAFFVFPQYSSVLSIAFITIALVPLLQKFFEHETRKEKHFPLEPIAFIGRHFKLIKFYGFVFLGIAFSYALWHLVLPENESFFCLDNKTCIELPNAEIIAKEQKNVLFYIENLSAKITGKAKDVLTQSKNNGIIDVLEIILFNNLEVMVFAWLLSLLYGAGALMLIGWNASVIGILISESIKDNQIFLIFSLIPHGIPELLAYFLAAISGQIIDLVATKRNIVHGIEKLIFLDSIFVFFMAVVSLVVGALIESLIIFDNEFLALFISSAYIIIFAMIIFYGIGKRHYW